MFRNGAYFISPNSANTAYNQYLRLIDGYVQFTNSARAPIFYDSNDTGYYLDPNSTSDSALRIRGGALHGPNPTWGAYLSVGTNGWAGSGSYASVCATNGNLHIDAASGYYMYLNYYAGIGVYFGNGASGGIYASILNDGSFRSPIFYDYNDTGYYLDAASTSRINQINYTGLYYASNTAYGVIGANGFFDTVNSGVDADALELCYVYGSEVRIGTGGGNKAIRASIFYEGTNTAYYVDPNGGSNVLGDFRVNQNGAAGIQLLSTTGTQSLWIRTGYSGAPTPSVSATNVQFQSSGSSAGTFNFWCGNTLSLSILGDYAEGAGSLRAPIFYDSNDTGYYLDPNGYSNLNRANFIAQGSDATSSIYIGGQNVSTSGSLWINFHADGDGAYRIGKPAGAWTQPLEVRFYTGQRFRASASYGGFQFIDYNTNGVVFDMANGGSFTRSNVNFYAPIMYDNNDSGFYVDPNSSSRFQTVDINNTIYSNDWFRSYGATGWFNQSYSGGIFMQDTTWVRVYNGKAFYVPNEIAATGNITAYYSDERLKTKTGGIDNALEKVSGLSGFLYVENDLARSLGYTNAKQQVGVSAQAVQAVLPEAVSLAPVDFETLEDGTIISKSGENYLTVDYSRLVPLLIEAIKELTDKVKALEAKEQ
jgi:hypothetical protein